MTKAENLRKIQGKLKEVTGKGLLANKPADIKKALSGTVASKMLTKYALKYRAEMMRNRRK